jgi:hypothetical protein
MTSWNDFTATLSEQDHKRLDVAMGAGARKASGIATINGDAAAAREHLFAALENLMAAAQLMRPNPYA